jgi:HAUS augmin-like complex subunit 8
MPKGGKKPNQIQKNKDSSGTGKGDLQPTLLEGPHMALPDLNLSAINDKSQSKRLTIRKRRMSEK